MTTGGSAVVIGGGIAGCTVALALADAAVEVVLVEARLEGAGATGAAAGLLSPQYEADHESPLFPLLLRARAAYGEFVSRLEAAAARGLDHRRDGLLVANLDAAEHEEA
ncbi:MAG: FAD-dependent oxidoreductase, partial [Gemmatimonadota bacterium]